MLKKIFLFIAITWSSVVLTLCLIKLKDVDPSLRDIENMDKYIHILFHLVLTTVWFLFFRVHYLKNRKYNPNLIAFLFSFVLGIVIEFLQQYFTATRSGDILDIVANVFGAILGVIFSRILNIVFFKPKVAI